MSTGKGLLQPSHVLGSGGIFLVSIEYREHDGRGTLSLSCSARERLLLITLFKQGAGSHQGCYVWKTVRRHIIIAAVSVEVSATTDLGLHAVEVLPLVAYQYMWWPQEGNACVSSTSDG